MNAWNVVGVRPLDRSCARVATFAPDGAVFDRARGARPPSISLEVDPRRRKPCREFSGLSARQPFLAEIDLTRPIGELLARTAELVEQFGTSGYLEPGLVDNLIPEEAL